MALVVEDGTVVAGANAYITTTFADVYFAARGNQIWVNLARSQKEQAIVQATDYIQYRWGRGLRGSVASILQVLAFPRIYSYGGAAVIPVEVKYAAAEYAVRASQAPLAPDIILDQTGRLAIKTVEEVGPIREEVSYATNGMGGVALPSPFRPYPVPDALMQGLVRGTSNRVMRA